MLIAVIAALSALSFTWLAATQNRAEGFGWVPTLFYSILAAGNFVLFAKQSGLVNLF